MGAIKLTKIGNSQGLTIPKEILDKGSFSVGDSLEIHLYNGRLILFKKLSHHSEMKFEGNTDLSAEDKEWLESDLGEWEGQE
jgi:antitoxin component of MazEF toxin-antitoxin module